MTGYNITNIYRGGDYSLIWQALDDNGNPINLSGYTFSSTVKEKYSSITGIESFIINLLTGQSGIFSIYLNNLQTSGLAVGTYPYTIQAQTTGSFINLMGGYINVNPTTII